MFGLWKCGGALARAFVWLSCFFFSPPNKREKPKRRSKANAALYRRANKSRRRNRRTQNKPRAAPEQSGSHNRTRPPLVVASISPCPSAAGGASRATGIHRRRLPPSARRFRRSPAVWAVVCGGSAPSGRCSSKKQRRPGSPGLAFSSRSWREIFSRARRGAASLRCYVPFTLEAHRLETTRRSRVNRGSQEERSSASSPVWRDPPRPAPEEKARARAAQAASASFDEHRPDGRRTAADHRPDRRGTAENAELTGGSGS